MTLQEQLGQIIHDLQHIKSETSLMLSAVLLLVVGLITNRNLVIKGLFAMSLLFAFYFNFDSSSNGLYLSKAMFGSAQASVFTGLFLLVSLLVLIFRRPAKHNAEFYFLILSLLIGCVFMMKANSLLVVYLSVELVSFGSYILTNFSFKRAANEAAIKYLLFGATSSAIMLLGIGLVYGGTGTVFLSVLSSADWQAFHVEIGLMLIIFGLLFKASVAPFHIWVPATYQTAPVDATAFISIVPKLASLVLLHRIFQVLAVDHSHWMVRATLALGLLTLVLGTLGALRQTNFRRLISMGAIAHSGFLLPFALLSSSAATEAFWWYAVAYAVMNVGVFYLVDHYERVDVHDIHDFAKLKKQVWLGVVTFTILMSLVGIPPFAGFTAKFFLFSSLWEMAMLSNTSIYLIYLMSAVLSTVVALFYYLRPSYYQFIAEAKTKSINFLNSSKYVVTLFAIALLLLFFAPQLVTLMQQFLNNGQ